MQLTLDVTPTLLRSAGVKNHLYYWVQSLLAEPRNHRISLFPYVKSLEPLHHDRGLEGGVPNWRLFLLAAQQGKAATWGRYLIPKAGIFHTASPIRQRPRCARLTSHIHDLTCWIMPEMHTVANVRASAEIADNIWRTADALIAVSESARQDAIRILGLPPDRITVIHHGVPENYFAIQSSEIAAVRSKLALSKPYVLVIGTIEPRKNIERLLDAWEALPAVVRADFDLVFAGPHGWKADRIMQRLKVTGGPRYLGYVAEDDLPPLTAGATALAYPSLYEGFGFPLAQAMACGVPSLTSNVSSLPEVAAGSAILVDPLSPAEICHGLERLLTSPELRLELGERGRAYAAAHYRWAEVASRSWKFFEALD